MATWMLVKLTNAGTVISGGHYGTETHMRQLAKDNNDWDSIIGLGGRWSAMPDPMPNRPLVDGSYVDVEKRDHALSIVPRPFN